MKDLRPDGGEDVDCTHRAHLTKKYEFGTVIEDHFNWNCNIL